MDKFSEMSHAERIAYLASKVALAKSYDSPVLTVPIPDLELVLAELEREQGMRAQNLEIKTLLSEKVKGLETKLWDSQQLVDVKNGSQIELRSQISSLEESNRKDMAWREERLCELEDSLEAAQERISELEAKLATPIVAPDDGFDDFKEIRPDSTNDFDTGYNFGLYRYEQNIRAAGFKCVGDE